jgi:hypothetical protein
LFYAFNESVAEAMALQYVKELLCDILSNASLKSSYNTHRGMLAISVFAIASRTVATASNIDFPGTPQYLLGWSNSTFARRVRFASMPAMIL